MTRKAHIVSFEDARASDPRSVRSQAAKSPRHTRDSRAETTRSSRASGGARTASTRAASARTAGARSTSARLASSNSQTSRNSRELPSWIREESQRTLSYERERERMRFELEEELGFASPADSRAQRRSPAIQSFEEFEEEERLSQGEARARKSSKKGKSLSQKLANAKKKRVKEKAGRKFTKQFGGESSGSEDSGPRAAVYKGEMGAKQRKATRMQSNDFTHASSGARYIPSEKHGLHDGSANAKPSLPSRIANVLFGTRPRIAAVSIAACLVLGCLFMYPAAKQYYTELRHYDQIQAEYEAVQARNAELEAQRDFLSSEDGIEQTARENYGWVTEGEHAVIVYGLDTDSDIVETSLSIPSGSVKPPETWYSVFLDPLFGIE